MAWNSNPLPFLLKIWIFSFHIWLELPKEKIKGPPFEFLKHKQSLKMVSKNSLPPPRSLSVLLDCRGAVPLELYGNIIF